MNRSQVLLKAAKLISGNRQRQYGDAGVMYKATEATIVASGLREASHLPPAARFMLELVLMKIVRICRGSLNEDNFVDAAGYLGLATEEVYNPTQE